MKKLICFLLTLCLLCPMASVFAAEPLFAGGDGTPENPYQIATLEQLIAFRELVNEGNTSICAKLIDNIAINKDPIASIRAGESNTLFTFTPIATNEAPYNGTFDGNHHTITGLYCDLHLSREPDSENYYDYYALFKELGKDGTIKDLNLDKIYLSAVAPSSAYIALAGIVSSNQGHISGCSTSGNIFASSAKGHILAGGICATSVTENYVENCTNFCNLTSKVAEGVSHLGGVAGSNGRVRNCINYGDIHSSLLNQFVSSSNYSISAAGVVSAVRYGSIDNCYNFGNITVIGDKENCRVSVGGVFVGYSGDPDDMFASRIYNFGNVTAIGGASASAGGCCASVSTLTEAYNKGNVTATSPSKYVNLEKAGRATAVAGGITVSVSVAISNAHNYGSVSVNGDPSSSVLAGGICAKFYYGPRNGHPTYDNTQDCISYVYNMGTVSASEGIFSETNAIAARFHCYDFPHYSHGEEILAPLHHELYSLVGVAPLDESCTALTQEQFKTLWTDETHPEWNYAPVFEDALYQETPFCDTNPRSWYYDATVYTYLNQLMNGTSMTTFDPNLRMTRAMLVTVLYRMAGSPDVSGMNTSFPDLPSNAWYTNAVIWAANHGIVNGYQEDGKFHPEWNITRQDIATVFYRYVTGYLGETPDVSGNLSAFPDGNNVAAYARDAMAWANGAGLITGTREGNQTLLDPRGAATRAQIATILMRYCKNTAQ